MTWNQSRMHRDNVLKAAEELKGWSLPAGVAVTYCELSRREWAEKAAKRDPSFSHDEAVQKVNEDREGRSAVPLVPPW